MSSGFTDQCSFVIAFCGCIIDFADKCMHLHSQSVLTLVLLGAQKSNMEVSRNVGV